jgi:hypothetical protein
MIKAFCHVSMVTFPLSSLWIFHAISWQLDQEVASMVTFKLFSFETFSFLLLISFFFYAFISFQYAFEEHHAGFKVLSSRLKKLENLLLSEIQCNDSIFPSLTGFSSLKSLDLSYNYMLKGSGIIHSFYLPKCFTWHSLNYIVSSSTKMRTLYLFKINFVRTQSRVYN